MPPLDQLPRINLLHAPTPLEPLPRLSAALGRPRLRRKRDDCTGLALGGNKVRKLEYLLGEALRHGSGYGDHRPAASSPIMPARQRPPRPG